MKEKTRCKIVFTNLSKNKKMIIKKIQIIYNQKILFEYIIKLYKLYPNTIVYILHASKDDFL